MQSALYQEIFAKGKLEGERLVVADLCEVLGVDLTAEREGMLQRLDLEQITELRAHLKRDRAWPDLRT